MRKLLIAAAVLSGLASLAALAGTVALAWIAAAPHHEVEANRAFLLFFIGIPLGFLAVALGAIAGERR